MTENNKPIIINANKCKYRDEYTNFCLAERNELGDSFTMCTGTDCYFKQLARKTQSEERLIKQIQTICNFINNRPEIFKGIYGDVDKIITDYAERKEQECKELKSQLTSLSYADTICALEIDLEHKTQEYEELKRDNSTLFNKAAETRKDNVELQVQLDKLKMEKEQAERKLKRTRKIANYSFNLSTHELRVKLEQIIQIIDEV